ncbi:MAG: HlyD family efflux transporter periplasmic adaptor subunit, partial [Cyclobacteriaceae bacterium]
MPEYTNPDRNQDVREILEDIPSAIFRYGNLVFLIIILVFTLIAWFIKYPDVLQAGITITSSSPPVPIIANSSGELTNIRVAEGSRVKKGDILAIIQSTTDPDDAFALLEAIEKIQINQIEKLITEEVQWSENLNLGALNDDYADFLNKYYEYWRFKKYNPLDEQLTEETTKLSELAIYQQKLSKQGDIFDNEIRLLRKDYERDKKLFEKKVISQKLLEEKERQLLALQREFQTNQLEISQVKINIADSRKVLSDFTFQKEERNQSLRLALFDSYKQLQFAIKNWERNYVLRSTVDGIVSLFDYWSENQYVSMMDEIFTVVPSEDSEKIGKVLLPIRNSGKIELGQKAIIKLDDFLYQEYGTLAGTVSKVSLVPRGNLYAVEINLVEGLTT